MVYLCAWTVLPHARRRPVLAGLIAAFSLTSISLSSSVLTETLFFTVQAGSLCCLLYGVTRDRWPCFLAWGALAGAAVLIRAAAQFWVIAVFLALALAVLMGPFRLPRGLVSKAAAGLAVALVIMAGWSGRNYAVHGKWSIASVGMTTMRLYWTAAALASVEGSDVVTVRERWAGSPHVDDRQVVVDTIRRYPWPMAKTYVTAVIGNATAASSLQADQLPGYPALWNALWFRRLLFRAGLLLLVLAMVGLLALFRQSLQGVLLGITYGYFMLVSGFTFWQGSRITYPAQMAGAVLAAVAAGMLVDVARWLVTRLSVLDRK